MASLNEFLFWEDFPQEFIDAVNDWNPSQTPVYATNSSEWLLVAAYRAVRSDTLPEFFVDQGIVDEKEFSRYWTVICFLFEVYDGERSSVLKRMKNILAKRTGQST